MSRLHRRQVREDIPKQGISDFEEEKHASSDEGAWRELDVCQGEARKTSQRSFGQETLTPVVKIADRRKHVTKNKWPCPDRKATMLAD